MSQILVYALGLVAAFIAWYFCRLVPNRPARGVLRATCIALLCSPAIVAGHGIGVLPSVTAVFVQPSIFSFGSILIVWIIALGIILGVPSLRRDPGDWPPSVKEIFLDLYPFKFVFFGLVAATLMWSMVHAQPGHGLWLGVLKYGFFFAAAGVNVVLCYFAGAVRRANPLLTPLYFSLPVLPVAAPAAAFLWYGAGAIGGLIGSGRARIAAWAFLGIFGLLSVNSLVRVYHAAHAPPHVTIGGGVAGNAAMAVLFAALAVAPWWWILWRRKNEADIQNS